MVRFGIIGSGWRAMFYLRAAKALPEQFDLCMVLCRREEEARRIREQYDVPACCDEKAMLEAKPDFVVSCVNKAAMCDTVIKWLGLGVPVLSETPVSLERERLEHIWELCSGGKLSCTKLQVAEQYAYYPVHDARIKIIKSGLIGEPVSMTLSYMHDYHAASIIRKMLDTGLEDVRIAGKAFMMPVTETRTRYEILTKGEVVKKEEKHLVMEYESQKTAFYDFMSDQYRSGIRNRFMNVRGTRGELMEDTFYFLRDDNIAASAKMDIYRDEDSGEVLSVKFMGETVYAPPFGICGLSEDETAVARMLAGMKNYIDGGDEVYPLREALEDAYIAEMMTRAAENPWKVVSSEKRPWK